MQKHPDRSAPSTGANPEWSKTRIGTWRRQWGSERDLEPLSIMHSRPSARAITGGRIAMCCTVASWAIYVVTTIVRELIENKDFDLRFALELTSYVVVVSFLTFSAMMYMLARQGALYRFRDHRRVPREPLDQHFDGGYDKLVTVLVPSYIEEISVVRKTLWSAALQEFPNLRVVLLIDDPPNPTDPARIASLEATRETVVQIQRELETPRLHVAALLEDFHRKHGVDGQESAVDAADMASLADGYLWAAQWLETMALNEPLEDHTDYFFIEQVLSNLAGDLRLTELALRGAISQKGTLPFSRMRQLHNRLVWIFSADVTSFERKQYRSLSHEANKAMNLNSYISLIGGEWTKVDTPDGVVLKRAEGEDAVDLSVPESEYLLTLDADSMLLRDYCLRLVEYLERPEFERVAVTQTPYSSYRGAPTRIERLAGATTDIQHIQHQGMTYYGATFWVGANAIIRTRALRDISTTEMVGGFQITTYIPDRTVIEDTESSIDIGQYNWSLRNYPERLSYSATPPDFGSLVVQRRRWADGGLLILPKLVGQIRKRRRLRETVLWREVMLRSNYLASIAWASVGLIFLLGYPYDSRLLSVWVFGAAIPYFVSMGLDLQASGHRFGDIFRIYGFNLVLLAVNVAGVLKSLQQAITGEKIPFARTPKVRDRTSAPAIYVAVPWVIVFFSLYIFYSDFRAQNWGNAAFALFNAVLCCGAIVAYIGVWNSIVDFFMGVLDWLFVPAKPGRRKRKRGDAARGEGPQAGAGRTPPEDVNWETILYHGDRRLGPSRQKDSIERRRKISHRVG
ncbi:glycosyltransferase family 2 protein [Actinomycetaceae bacterium L2_0104]